MKYNFETILRTQPELTTGKDPQAVSHIKKWFGHYRPDHFDQATLEDMRQRLSRRGVSLYSFQRAYLPILYEILQACAAEGELDALPPLFSYEMEPALLQEWGPLWAESFQNSGSATPQTVKRYRLVLERDLIPYFGGRDLCDLNGAEVEAYEREYLAQGRSKSCFQYQSRILYLTLDYYVSQQIQADEELTDALQARDTSYLYLKDVVTQWRKRPDCRLSSEEQQILSDYILPLLGLSNLKKYTSRRLARYRRELSRRGLSDSVFQRHLELLNQIKYFAEAAGLLGEKPTLENPKRGRFSNPHPVDPTAREKILLIPEDDPGGVILRLSLEMGLRNEEIRALKWPDVHLDERWAQVDGRRVPIPDGLCSLLHHRAVREGNAGYVVLTSATREGPISMQSLYVTARKTLRRYGLTDLRLYDLRSSYIIHLLRQIGPERTAAQCGFDKTEDLLMRYGAFLPEP